MRTAWLLHRRALLLVGLALVTVAALLLATVAAGPTHHPMTPRSAAGTLALRPSGPAGTSAARLPAPYAPPRVQPAPSAVQNRTDRTLAQAETPSALSAAETDVVPAPADSVAYPPTPVSDRRDPIAYAVAFATELLDRDYTRQSRIQLLAWAQGEEAPNTLPGVPASVADKALELSLDDPDLAGGPGPSPVPSLTEWGALTRAHVSQTVTGLQAQVDPDWTGLIASGWQPSDPAMTIMAVTGVLTTHQDGRTATASVALTITLGSARLRPGYGAVAVDDWTVN